MIKDKTAFTASFRFSKAQRCYSTALYLLEKGHHETAINYAYLSMYHAARALLTYDNIDFMNHGDIMRSFDDQYILQSYHDPRLCKVFEEAYNSSFSGIFNDDYTVSKETAAQQIKNAEYFLEVTGTISERRLALEYDAPDSIAESDTVPFPSSIGSKYPQNSG